MYLQASLFAGWVSAAAVVKANEDFFQSSNYYSTRAAYLFFTVVGDFVSLVILLINIFNIPAYSQSSSKLKKIPWTILVFWNLNLQEHLWVFNFFFLFLKSLFARIFFLLYQYLLFQSLLQLEKARLDNLVILFLNCI